MICVLSAPGDRGGDVTPLNMKDGAINFKVECKDLLICHESVVSDNLYPVS